MEQNNVNGNVTENNQEQNNNQAQQTANQQPHVMPQQKTEETMVGVPSWLVKGWNGFKKASKIVLPIATAVVGAFIGVKVGTNSASKKAQVTIDGLSKELSDTRLALEQKPDPVVPVEVTDVPFDAVSDVVPMDVVD